MHARAPGVRPKKSPQAYAANACLGHPLRHRRCETGPRHVRRTRRRRGYLDLPLQILCAIRRSGLRTHTLPFRKGVFFLFDWEWTWVSVGSSFGSIGMSRGERHEPVCDRRTLDSFHEPSHVEVAHTCHLEEHDVCERRRNHACRNAHERRVGSGSIEPGGRPAQEKRTCVCKARGC